MPESAFVSVAQAAEVLGITRQAVLKRIRTGRLPATKVGRSYIVPRSAFSAVPIERHPVVTEIVRRLIAAYDPERVYLFGSAARGDTNPNSDFDVLVIVPDDASPDRLRSRRAYEALWGLGVAVDVLVTRRGAFDARTGVPTSLPATVLEEGVLLHAA
jgi:excisionase family DNA binding protein